MTDRAETGQRISHHTAECPSHKVSSTVSLALYIQPIKYLEGERGKSPNSMSAKLTELIPATLGSRDELFKSLL